VTLIVSVGRLERYKGHHRVIAALPQVRERVPNVRLRILGSGPYEADLRQFARRCGVANLVDIGSIPTSDRSELASLLSQADLVTLLSEYEAQSISVAEALALGRKLLVTDTSALREFTACGRARGVPTNSSREEVATAILEELAAPASGEKAPLPSWDDCAAGVLRVYQGVAGRAAGVAS
jgi:glycosyltransferase involved in cell wall biosynthesis